MSLSVCEGVWCVCLHVRDCYTTVILATFGFAYIRVIFCYVKNNNKNNNKKIIKIILIFSSIRKLIFAFEKFVNCVP